MMLIQILQYIGCVLTVLVGLLSLVAPERTVNFTGLAPQGGRGITEIRSILGGLFIALGVVPFFLGDVAYTVLGVTYLAIGIVRGISIVLDKSGNPSNWFSLAFEIVFGVILVL
jgi:hypothetical protein